MSLTDVLKTPLHRLIPHEGLVIDVSTWDDAHQYHVANQRLHAMTMHNSGVVTGLEVVAWDPPDNSVVINPGIAVDSTGRTIVVGEPQRFQLQTDEAGTHYLVLQYREVPSDSGDASENGDSQPHHVLEAYRLEERSEAPDESYVELARVQISGNNNVVSEPADPYNPGPDEIDVRGDFAPKVNLRLMVRQAHHERKYENPFALSLSKGDLAKQGTFGAKLCETAMSPGRVPSGK